VVEQRPADQRWCHRRTLEVEGPQWRVQAWAGIPPAPLEEWIVAPFYSDFALVSESCVVAAPRAGEWQQVRGGWAAGTRTRIAVGSLVAEDSIGAGIDAAYASAFEHDLVQARIDVGGAALGRSFRGTIAAAEWSRGDFSLPGETRAFPSHGASLRWVLGPFAFGTTLLAVTASGEVPASTGLSWRITQIAGESRREVVIDGPVAQVAPALASAPESPPESLAPPLPPPAAQSENWISWIIVLEWHCDAEQRRSPCVEEISAVLLPRLLESVIR
jgi:hypothetical protein